MLIPAVTLEMVLDPGDQLLFFFVFLGLHPPHMEVPGQGVELEAHSTATATWNASQVCDLHHSSQQRQIFDPLGKARDRTRNLMVPSWIRFPCTTMGMSLHASFA